MIAKAELHILKASKMLITIAASARRNEPKIKDRRNRNGRKKEFLECGVQLRTTICFELPMAETRTMEGVVYKLQRRLGEGYTNL